MGYGHKEFFTLDLADYGKEFAEDTLVFCKQFELVDAKVVSTQDPRNQVNYVCFCLCKRRSFGENVSH